VILQLYKAFQDVFDLQDDIARIPGLVKVLMMQQMMIMTIMMKASVVRIMMVKNIHGRTCC